MEAGVVEKIRKLIAHERSARKIGSVAEAAAFAARIQDLLIKHNLSLIEVERDQPDKGAISEERYRVRPAWEAVTLAAIVTRAHFCAVIRTHDGLLFAGREEDRLVSIAMFGYLLSVMRRVARNEEALSKKLGRRIKRFKPAFYAGFLTALKERYRGPESEECTALMRHSKEAEAHIRKNHAVVERAHRVNGRLNRVAAERGYRAGQGVSLSPVKGEGTRRKRGVTDGRQQRNRMD